MKRISMLLVILAALPSLARSAEALTVEARIHRNGNSFTFEVVNKSLFPIRLSPPLFNSPDVLGHWLFLYDPKTKKIQTGWTTTFGTVGGKQGTPKFNEFMPEEKMSNTLTKEEILGYFIVIPNCFHLVYVVKLRQGDTLISSKPSNTIYMCKAS